MKTLQRSSHRVLRSCSGPGLRRARRSSSSASGLRKSMPASNKSRLRQLTEELRELEDRIRQGGGPDKIARHHKQGKLTARERIELLRDADNPFLEIGLLVAHDK